jgi:retinol dehydrogenase 14
MSDAPRLDGTESAIALVTGATEGIGYHTAQDLAAAGYAVLITGRDSTRGEQAASSIASATGSRVQFIQVDHSTVGANRQFAGAVGEQLQQSGGKLDILINNVGGIFAHRTVTPDGYEAALAVNFLAPYVVTNSLLPLLRAAAQARVVVLTSALGWLAHQVHGDLLDNLDGSGNYIGIEAYGRTKLLLTAWALRLSAELGDSGVTVTAVNPGAAWTRMTQALTPEVVPSWKYFYPLARWFQKRGDAAKAAHLIVRLATTASPGEINGRFFTERGKPGKIPAALLAPAFQERVAEVAARLTKQAPTASKV